MYKIYINDTPLLLLNAAEEFKIQEFKEKPEYLINRYPGKKKFLSNYIDLLEKTKKYEGVVLFAADYDGLKEDFNSLFKPIEAAGGVVSNENDEILAIYRLDTWDLPKGKIDPGESKEVAAVREVEEETGIKNINLGDFLTTTFHTYRSKKGKRILKITYWYNMTCQQQTLIPQLEENIEQAEWLSLSDLLIPDRIMYRSIRNVLELVKASR